MGKPTPSQASQNKTQKSISSFFTPKTINGTAARASQASQVPTNLSKPPPPVAPKIDNLYDEESEEEQEAGVKVSNEVGNSHEGSTGSKRPLTEDATAGNGSLVERPAKRVRSDDHGGEASSFFADTIPGTKSTSINTNGKSKVSPRTERFLYTASRQATLDLPMPEEEELDETEKAREKARKEELHKKWVKKMSGVSVGRRNWQVTEEATVTEEGEEAEEEEEPTPVKTKRKGAKTGKLTPLELQVLDIKRKHMDTLLIIEVGYKFKFFGEDARVAAKELSIVCIPGKFRYDERKSPTPPAYDTKLILIVARSIGSTSRSIRLGEYSCPSSTGSREETCSSWT